MRQALGKTKRVRKMQSSYPFALENIQGSPAQHPANRQCGRPLIPPVLAHAAFNEPNFHRYIGPQALQAKRHRHDGDVHPPPEAGEGNQAEGAKARAARQCQRQPALGASTRANIERSGRGGGRVQLSVPATAARAAVECFFTTVVEHLQMSQLQMTEGRELARVTVTPQALQTQLQPNGQVSSPAGG